MSWKTVLTSGLIGGALVGAAVFFAGEVSKSKLRQEHQEALPVTATTAYIKGACNDMRFNCNGTVEVHQPGTGTYRYRVMEGHAYSETSRNGMPIRLPNVCTGAQAHAADTVDETEATCVFMPSKTVMMDSSVPTIEVIPNDTSGIKVVE